MASVGSGCVSVLWRERDEEDNVRTGDSYVVTVGTVRSQYPLTLRAQFWPGWRLAGLLVGGVPGPATGHSQQSARATSQPTKGRADPAGWAGGTNGLIKTPGGSGVSWSCPGQTLQPGVSQ